MSRLSWIAFLAAFGLLGCQSETPLSYGGAPPEEEEEPEEEEPEELFPEFDNATLEVHSPASAEILFVEDMVQFDAEIVGEDGEVLDFDEIVWETDQAFAPIFEGNFGESFMDWGIHTFTVTANLPNGDRLQTVLGGVRIQGRHTGVYAGNLAMNVDMEFQGTPVNAACNGGLDFVIDMSGELLGGGGQCAIALVIIDPIDVTYEVNADVEDDRADGNVGIDIGFFALPIGFEGDFEGDGQLHADFEGGLLGFNMAGTLDAHRLSVYVDP